MKLSIAIPIHNMENADFFLGRLMRSLQIQTFRDFEIILMHHKEDNIKSIAIDEFPNMNEKVARQFLQKKIIEKRKEREISFRKLELQALLFDNFYQIVSFSCCQVHLHPPTSSSIRPPTSNARTICRP